MQTRGIKRGACKNALILILLGAYEAVRRQCGGGISQSKERAGASGSAVGDAKPEE